MSSDKLRRQIAFEAAKLLYLRREQDYQRAKWNAGRSLRGLAVRGDELPSDREVRDQMRVISRIHEAEENESDLRTMREHAARVMRAVRRFRPVLVGSVVTGRGDVARAMRIHLFADSLAAVTTALDAAGIAYRRELHPVADVSPLAFIAQLAIEDHYKFVVVIYAASRLPRSAANPSAARPPEEATLREVEELLAREMPGRPLKDDAQSRPALDRFEVYKSLLLPLEEVMQSPRRHPEGDALYHSLQVFELARNELPYDEEFLLAALLHDVGKGIDRHDHIRAGLEALDGFITPRTAWLIEHHADVAALRDGTLGARSRRRLERDESFEELKLLADCDRRGRVRGAEVPDVDEALACIRELAEACGE